MNNEDQFKVYVGHQIRGEFPVIIITAGSDYTQFSEYFICLSCDQSPKLFHCRFNHRGNESVYQSLGIDGDFMAKQAFEQAKFSLTKYLDEKYTTDSALPFDKRDFNLKESTPSFIVGLYLRGFFQKEFTTIQHETSSTKLRQFLANVLSLSKFVIDDISHK